MPHFEPIAIVGQACILPGALDPNSLWRAVRSGTDLIGQAPDGRWGLSRSTALTDDPDHAADCAWSDRGGYVSGFEQRLDQVLAEDPFRMPTSEVRALDPLFQWVLVAGRDALRDAGYRRDSSRIGAIFGNLSFPSSALSRFAESTWLDASTGLAGGRARELAGIERPDPRNRYMSGLPAHLLAEELGLGAGAFTLDAACASSLYAIKLACDKLHDREADAMLAGAVCRSDDLFIHVGFCALNAMSRTGRSRPFHAGADGLVPAEGCAFVVLKRLADAEAEGDRILGVIRGVGLSNDGRGRGLLAPSSDGQVRAMELAYEGSGLTPADVQYVECHATGTTVGDATELRSMARVFGADRGLPIGSLKSNMGHLITAAGAAGLIKVLKAFEAGELPPTLHVDEPNPVLDEAGLSPVLQPRPWSADGPRIAAVSAFGFGGNNAHLLVQEYTGRGCVPVLPRAPVKGEIALVAMSVTAGSADGVEAFRSVALGEGIATPEAGPIDLPLRQLKFPPNDLRQTLPQQLLVLRAAMRVAADRALDPNRTGVIIGSQADPEVCRYGARWRLRDWAHGFARAHGLATADPSWVESAMDAVVPVLESAGVVGNMPNIPANRINSQLDLGGPGFIVSSEELSGLTALQLGLRMLRARELDAALVGAVDLCCEDVHRAAAHLLPKGERTPADATVVFLLKRLEDARASGDAIIAVFPDGRHDPELELGSRNRSLAPKLGHAHAASALLHVAAAALAVRDGSARTARVVFDALGGAEGRVTVSAPPSDVVKNTQDREPTIAEPRLTLPSHPPAVRLTPMADQPTSRVNGTQVMDPAPALPSVLLSVPGALAGPTGFEPEHIERPLPASPASREPVSREPVSREPVIVRHAPAALTPAAIVPPDVPSPPMPAPTAMPTSGHPMTAMHGDLAQMHASFLQQQAAVHRRFLEVRQQATNTLLQAWAARRGTAVPSQPTPYPAQAPATPSGFELRPTPPAPAPTPLFPPGAPVAVEPPAGPTSTPTARPTPVPAPAALPKAKPAAASPATTEPAAKPKTPAKPRSKSPRAGDALDFDAVVHPPANLPGPRFDRAQLESLASDVISVQYGPMFAIQDDFPRQVRMPEPPLLLCDRVTGIDAEPGSMKTGTIWTESDVTWDDWYLHEGHMPAGIMIESGQADLLLISWLGADFQNRGERVYRLLGCELTYHGGLPQPGDTLKYDIHVDGHANQGATRIFFFHYDCRVDGKLRLAVRQGQAGFFSDAELANSGGVLWTPADTELVENPRIDPPKIACAKTAFDRSDLEAFSNGDGYACFGAGFEYLQAHVRTPRISPKPMLFFEEVTHCEAKGGPWKRGYLRAIQKVSPEDWYFDGHFKDDPCMPGTLMFEACLQAGAFFMASLGYTVDKDGWRFEPVPDVPYQLICRGQVTPTSREVVYEVFVEEVWHDGKPTIWVDFLCTCDGLKAFYARRVGLQLTPDYPLSSRPEWLSEYVEPKPVAKSADGFPFDYASLMACAWGKPSHAFGPMYTPFDQGRHCARLPGPPYHFMSRLVRISQEPGEYFRNGARAAVGCEIELEYDIPDDSWYFDQNGNRTMPFAVLLEAALQPCGWIACYVGSALTVDEDLYFRNLDGTGTLTAELLPTTGTLRTVAKLTNISNAGGMIIESFDVQCFIGDTEIYTLKTVFGFFPTKALANQVGITYTKEERAKRDAPSDFLVDLTQRPERYCGGKLALPKPMLLMLDRVTGYWPEGGKAGLGKLRSEKDVDPAEWFFKAHFYSDPVQPGSLGIEAMIQLLQFFMIERGMDEGMEAPRFEPLMLGNALKWSYRGQVVPRNKTIFCEIDITGVGEDERGRFAICDAYLWVDELRIYSATGMGMRIVDGAAPGQAHKASLSDYPFSVPHERKSTGGPDEEILDPAPMSAPAGRTGWVADHQPTWTVPALPAMSMVDRLAEAAWKVHPDKKVIGLRDVQVHRWIPVPTQTRLRARAVGNGDERTATLEVWREAAVPALSRFETAATGTTEHALFHPPAPAAWEIPAGGEDVADPYESGTLFHGPAFRYLTALRRGDGWSVATLDAGKGTVPRGRLSQGLLDALTHGIPHDSLHRWSSDVAEDLAAYPWRIERLALFADLPDKGELTVIARFDGMASGREPRIQVQAQRDGKVLAELTLVEILLPKGPIGSVDPTTRLAFLRDGDPSGGLGLSTTEGDTTTVDRATVKGSDWLPGTVARVYALEAGPVEAQVAAKDHVARQAGVHPATVQVHGDHAVSRALPLTRWPIEVRSEAGSASVRSSGEPALDLGIVRSHWDRYFQTGRWPVEDLYYGLIQRFVRQVHVVDPDAFDAVRGRSLLYLGNHQVGVESLIFSIVASALSGVNTVTLAKIEHQTTWLGRLIAHCFAWPDAKDPQVITFFDRSDKSSLPTIVGELAAEMTGPGKSVMVHIEGTRSLECRTPVEKMSGMFVDMALNTHSPVVPIRFTGGLPIDPLKERLEFPVGMGTQDIWLGTPILPEELAALPLKERKDRVIDAINALGPSNADEQPNPADAALAKRVKARMKASGADHEHATLFEVLREVEGPTAPIQRLLDAGASGEPLALDGSPEDAWLRELAERLKVPAR